MEGSMIQLRKLKVDLDGFTLGEINLEIVYYGQALCGKLDGWWHFTGTDYHRCWADSRDTELFFLPVFPRHGV